MSGVLDGLGWRHAAVPMAIVGLAAGLVAGAAGIAAVAATVGSSLVVSGLIVLAAAPVAAIALRNQTAGGGVALAIVAGMLVLNVVALTLPRVGPFSGLDWNWQGKTLDLVWMLAVIALLSPALRREIGWRLDVAPGTLGPALVNICLWGAIGFAIARMGTFGDPTSVAREQLTFERLLFDTTHPNLVEEIALRGFMLALLDRAFGPRWTVLGARVGWGVVLTAWLFGLLHGISLEAGAVVFDPAWLAQTFAMGLALGWIRALTGSLWPAFLGHCAPEIGILLALASVAWQ